MAISVTMENNPYRALMRIFFQFQASAVLYLEENTIAGIIEKKTIEELMSDLSQSRINMSLPVKRFSSSGESIEALISQGAMLENQQAIPVVDHNINYVGLWTRADILKSISSTNIHPKSADLSENMPEKSKVKDDAKKEENLEQPRPEVKISTMAESNSNSANKIREANAEKDNSEDEILIDSNYITIKTLEALPIPMVALDTRGEVLFYNKDWVNLQKKFKDSLGVSGLMRISRDLMAKLAFEGILQIDSVLELPGSPKGYQIKMKSILGDAKNQSKVFGYVFWAEIVPEQSAHPGAIGTKHASFDTEKHSPDIEYSGKTLVELLHDEERKIMQWAMAQTGDNQSNAAMLLGIPRQTFSYRYHKLFSKKKQKR
ncbi:MAG: hypothetical protein OEV66_04065 [Spirochaetia bacterium]|nr:hypothetical protein [Spirochaetia bacterium]